ncbi:MAG: aldo/keto reductase [Phycisphaerae bacterium]|nr:aldo/keto reductase [Phycisphaerae bacterium]
MDYRTLGRSDIRVSPVIFGAWAIGEWMWGPQDHEDALAAIRTAREEGVNAFDTAPVYGFGQSEELLAEALQGVKRQDVVLLTKFGLRWDHGQKGTIRFFETKDMRGKVLSIYKYAHPDSVIEECERSLKRLKTDYIDVYQIHWPDETTPIEDTFGAVKKLIEQGKVRAAGVSNCSPEQMARANAITPLATSQPPFSMILRDAEEDVIPWCRENHVGVIVYSPLQRGLLTGKIKPGHSFAEGDHRAGNAFFQPANVQAVNAFLEKIRPIAQAHEATLAQLVISWTLRRAGITATLVGARNARQARENAAAMHLTLRDEEIARIDRHLAEITIQR